MKDEERSTQGSNHGPAQGADRRRGQGYWEQPMWLWPNRLPVGRVTLLAGEPGVGKSLVALDWAARISAGRYWPGESERPDGPRLGRLLDGMDQGIEQWKGKTFRVKSRVLILANEDGHLDTIRPRMIAAGGDMSRVTGASRHSDVCKGVNVSLDLQPGVLDAGLRAFEHHVRLVIVDPLTDFLSRTSMSDHAAARRAMNQLAATAWRWQTAVLVIAHLSKRGSQVLASPGQDLRARAQRALSSMRGIVGSPSLAAVSRLAYVLVNDPADPSRRLLVTAKNNFGPVHETMGLRIVNEPGQRPPSPRVVWEADRPEARRLAERAPRLTHAARWLDGALAEGPVAAGELERLAAEQGIRRTTLHRARRELGVPARRIGFGRGACYVWG